MTSFTAAKDIFSEMWKAFRLQIRTVADNWMVQLQPRKGRERNTEKFFTNILPDVPSGFLARHHLPDLSTISRISPFVNVISLGSSGFAVSCGMID